MRKLLELKINLSKKFKKRVETKTNTKIMEEIKVLELFSGIGGMHFALKGTKSVILKKYPTNSQNYSRK